MNDDTFMKKIQDYISQENQILTFLLDEKQHKALTKIIVSNPYNGSIILDFLDKIDTCIPLIEDSMNILQGKQEFTDPNDFLHLMGDLADIYDMADIVMGLYLKSIKEGDV